MKNAPISVVTGGSGFVGSHLVDLLIEKGHVVRCIVRESSNLKWLDNKNIEIFKSGLFDKNGLKEVLRDADYLFHVAGVVKSKKKEGYYSGNVDTTKNLLEVIVEENIKIKRVLIVSSQTATGPSNSEKAKAEDETPNPITTYGKSKRAQEVLALNYSDKIPITIVRPPAVYGERDTEIFLVFKSYNQGLMSMVGFDEKRLSLVHVSDLVNGIYLAATNESSAGEIYHIGSDEFYSWPEMSKYFAKAFGKNALKIRLPHFLVYGVATVAQFFAMFSSKPATFNLEKAKDFVQKYWTLNVDKAKKELGYKQNMPIQEGVKRTADWYLDNNWL
ncbi:MAG: NAD-dependent epimerase/dehydratase family protein [Melioribacteraceae bacterium]|nr:NAD-dependent epimerase/dehydratase family protein [Melioribacteraceae bacterium]MCF8264991.1 NAD-dependent epimerase/dehydratase family protein [Melioribacteraceae bacterium]MCF8414265.1 NAD-dependent epimerase/dehydratase family protein [Melioribacteraceae bacterium]MCF8431472.1 NAD-dependent epimerase/dehydratase family protein [Melioribacteraceae bacterium]